VERLKRALQTPEEVTWEILQGVWKMNFFFLSLLTPTPIYPLAKLFFCNSKSLESLKLTFTKDMKLAIMRVAIDLGVFDILSEKEEVTALDVAKAKNADEKLIGM
jgi:hypothetical protein